VPGTGFVLLIVGTLVWDANAYPIKKYRERWGLDLRWPPIDHDTQQSTYS
jgi:hypothetical protein